MESEFAPMRSKRGGWTWTEDRQWARSWFSKRIDEETRSISWQLETRSEDLGAGTVRLGVLRMRGTAKDGGDLVISILEEDTTGNSDGA